MSATSSESDYIHDATIPHTVSYLHAPIHELISTHNIKKVLDIGCGNGALAQSLQSRGIEIVGLDPSESGIENCKKLLPNQKFYCMGIYDSPDKIEETEFDAVISTEVVEHLFYPSELPRFAYKKLKPGGRFIVTTPYHGYLKNLMIALFNKWDSHHTPLWDGGHIKFWSKQTLSKLIIEEGFEVENFVGCGRFPYLWMSMLLVGIRK